MKKKKEPPTEEQRQRKADRKARRNEPTYFAIMLMELLAGVISPFPPATRRPRVLIADVLFAMIYRTYMGVAGDKLTAFLKDLVDKGYITTALTPSSLFNYMAKGELLAVLEALIGKSSLPLRLFEVLGAIDSTGIYTTRYYIGRDWETGAKVEMLDWVRLHVVCGVFSKVITAARAAPRYSGENRYFEPLLRETLALGFKLKGIAGDKNYVNKKNIRLATELRLTPYLTFKKNAVLSKKQEEKPWNESLLKFRGGDQEVLQRYRDRSMVETTHSSLKRKYNKYVFGVNKKAQLNEALTKVICYNICVWNRYAHRLGIIPTYKSELSD
jgi:hypothetical protein